MAPLDRPFIKLEFDPNHFDIEGSRRLLLKENNRVTAHFQAELLCHDWLIVYGENAGNESDAISPGPRICGGGGQYGAGGEPPQPIIAQRKMIIDFHTDFALAGNGFRLMYSTSESKLLNVLKSSFSKTLFSHHWCFDSVQIRFCRYRKRRMTIWRHAPCWKFTTKRAKLPQKKQEKVQKFICALRTQLLLLDFCTWFWQCYRYKSAFTHSRHGHLQFLIDIDGGWRFPRFCFRSLDQICYCKSDWLVPCE